MAKKRTNQNKLGTVQTLEVKELFKFPAVYTNKTYVSTTQDGHVRLSFADEHDAGIDHRGSFIMSVDNFRSIQRIINQVLEQIK